MSTFKRTKVKLLESDNSHAPIGIDGEGTIHPSNPFCDSYHMYFLSDDEIKEGDWMHVESLNKVIQCTDDSMHDRQDLAKKIIATTDKSIAFEESLYDPRSKTGGMMIPKLAQPSQGFIQKFVEKGGIWEVMIEYESFAGERTLRIQRDPETIYDGSLLDERVKVSSDNTITIRPVKDSWNREEVIEDIEKAMRESLSLAEYRDRWIL